MVRARGNASWDDSASLVDLLENRNGQDVPVAIFTDEPSLHRLLALATSFQRSADASELAERVCRGVADFLGFERVLFRLKDRGTDRFDLRASTGCDSEQAEDLGGEMDQDALAELSREECRVGRSYLSPCRSGTWSDEHRLIVPLLSEEKSVKGLLELSRPTASQMPDPATVHLAEMLADQATLALSQVRLREELSEKRRQFTQVSERIDELENLKGNFVAAVSHELRTPLTSIRAYCDLLLDPKRNLDEATRNEFLGVIEGESQRLTDRVDDLFELADSDQRVRRARRHRFDLCQLARDARTAMAPLGEQKGIELSCDLPATPLIYQADRAALEQMLLKLLENAIKFTHEGGRVVIVVIAHEGRAEIVVEDTGMGIPEEEAERVFERFYQVDGSATRVHGGQGLGLAICREIVADHDGRIWVERGEHGGARFRVTLPRRRSVVQSEGAEDIDARVSDELRGFLDLAVVLVSELMGTRIASIMVGEPDGESLRIEAAVGLEEDVVHGTRVSRGEGIAGRVWNEASTILLRDIRQDERFNAQVNHDQYSNYSLLSCPLRIGGEFAGVLNVNNKLDGGVFDEDDRLLLEALASRIARAYESFDEFQRGHRRLADARAAMRSALEVTRNRRSGLRDEIARCAMATARRLGFDEEDLRSLSYALRIYDLGLHGVGEHVLRKRGPFTAEDRRKVEDHVRLGAEIGGSLEVTPGVQQVLYYHHENVDGSGYPEGLEGEAIPLGARIVRLVDALNAMLHGRLGRDALSLDEAWALLAEGSGRRFCERTTITFLTVMAERELQLRSHLEATRAAVVDDKPLGEPLEER